MSCNVSQTRICRVPSQQGQSHLLDYLTDARVFGHGYEEMRKAMRKSVSAFAGEDGLELKIPGELGLTVSFLGQVVPEQGIFCGTSSFRLDAIARYFESDGAEKYFTDGLGVAWTADDARRFCDEILYEILEEYHPPRASNTDNDQYVSAALASGINRRTADRTFLSNVHQLGEMWGTLLAVRGYSHGESFVARNVGLRTVWEHGQWAVKLIFMDHDNMHIVDTTDFAFRPYRSLAAVLEDESYIVGTPGATKQAPTTLSTLERVYRVDHEIREQGLRVFHQAIGSAYAKTHQAMVRAEFEEIFAPVFIRRLRDWDTVVGDYLAGVTGSTTLRSWKARWRKELIGRGYEEGYLNCYLACIDQHADFFRRYSYLYVAQPQGN